MALKFPVVFERFKETLNVCAACAALVAIPVYVLEGPARGESLRLQRADLILQCVGLRELHGEMLSKALAYTPTPRMNPRTGEQGEAQNHFQIKADEMEAIYKDVCQDVVGLIGTYV